MTDAPESSPPPSPAAVPGQRVPPSGVLTSFPPFAGPRGARRALLFLYACAFVLACWVLWPFRTPLFLAAVFGGALEPVFNRLTHRLRGRRRLASAFVAVALFVLLVAPIASTAAFAFRELMAGLAWLRDSLGLDSVGDLTWEKLPPSARQFVERLLATFHINRSELTQVPGVILTWLEQETAPILGAGLSLFAGSIVMLAALYVFLLDGRGVLRFLVSMSPLSEAQTRELIGEFRRVSTAALLGTAATAVVQGTLAGVGYLIAGVPQAFFLGLATLLTSFIPVIGTSLIFVPVVAVLWLKGKVGWAVFVAVWCGVGVPLSDNVVKPLVIRGSVAMHTGLLFLALLGGIAAFGLVGIILGPLVVAFLLAVQRIYLRDFAGPEAESSRPPG
jgi:predicted PurR-regulated permease PerM